LVGHIEGGTEGDCVRGKEAAEDILGYEGRSKGVGEDYIMRSFMTYTFRQIFC